MVNKKPKIYPVEFTKESLTKYDTDYEQLFMEFTEFSKDSWLIRNRKYIPIHKHHVYPSYSLLNFDYFYDFLIRELNQKKLSKKDFEKEIDASAIEWEAFRQGAYRAITSQKVEVATCTAAKLINIKLILLLAKFLEECEDNKIRLARHDAFEETISHFLLDAKRIALQQSSNTVRPKTQENIYNNNGLQGSLASLVQPSLTLKPARENDYNYYANAAFKVRGRDKEHQRLKDFLNDDLNVAWFQLAGVAGQGKSRLAFDLIKYADKELGWSAGFLEENGIRFFNDQWQIWHPDKPHLIVFDYVVGRENEIQPIFKL